MTYNVLPTDLLQSIFLCFGAAVMQLNLDLGRLLIVNYD